MFHGIRRHVVCLPFRATDAVAGRDLAPDFRPIGEPHALDGPLHRVAPAKELANAERGGVDEDRA